jgi:hypothetical protein
MTETIAQILAALDGVADNGTTTLTIWSDLYPPESFEDARGPFSLAYSPGIEAGTTSPYSLAVALSGPSTAASIGTVGEILNDALVRSVRRLGASK